MKDDLVKIAQSRIRVVLLKEIANLIELNSIKVKIDSICIDRTRIKSYIAESFVKD